MISFKTHPLADLYPPMTTESYDALKADIAANGLQTPIALHWVDMDSQYKVLDGRRCHRQGESCQRRQTRQPRSARGRQSWTGKPLAATRSQRPVGGCPSPQCWEHQRQGSPGHGRDGGNHIANARVCRSLRKTTPSVCAAD